METEPLGSIPPEVPAPDAPPPFPWTARLAGAFMLFNVVLSAAMLASGEKGVGGILIPLLVGGSLVRGNLKTLPVARGLSWLGLVLGFLICLADVAMGVGVILSSFGLLLLLGSDERVPSRWRVVVGGFLMFIICGLATIGVLFEVTGVNPFARAMVAGQSEPLPADRTLKGQTVPYSCPLPEGWLLVKKDEATKLNPVIENLSVNPDLGAYVGVIPETDVDPIVTLDSYKEAVKGNLPGAEWLEEKPLGDGVVLHSKEKDSDMTLERLILLKVKNGTAVQVHAWADSELFADSELKLREILVNFKL